MNIEIDIELPGWSLFWADLESTNENPAQLADLRSRVTETVIGELDRETIASHPTVAALRRLFKQAGCDPTRYRPSSEALLRRLLKGDPMPEISPLVDLNNCLSARLAVPCCVMAQGTFAGPFVFRAGAPGESYESLKGPFRLEGKPLLVDSLGPCDAPITGSARVKVSPETPRATLVAYLPRETVTFEDAASALTSLVGRLDQTTILGMTAT